MMEHVYVVSQALINERDKEILHYAPVGVFSYLGDAKDAAERHLLFRPNAPDPEWESDEYRGRWVWADHSSDTGTYDLYTIHRLPLED